MTTMVEKVSAAILARVPVGYGMTPDEAKEYARAAIEAMAAPTTKMCNAACAAMSPGKRPTPNRVSHKAKHAIRYRAMIRAALEEKQ